MKSDILKTESCKSAIPSDLCKILKVTFRTFSLCLIYFARIIEIEGFSSWEFATCF